MKNIFLLLWISSFFIPVYGQYDDSITGVRVSGLEERKIARSTKAIGLNYKNLTQYAISDEFVLKYPPDNPVELLRTVGTVISSEWVHEDGECILFIKCPGMKSWIDKSIDALPDNTFDRIRSTLGMGYFNKRTTEEQMEELKKILTFWPPEKSQEVFNAQHVITYPIKDKKSVYQGKYRHRLELIMIKWGGYLNISFLFTKKGYKNKNKYIKDVEGAFWFDD